MKIEGIEKRLETVLAVARETDWENQIDRVRLRSAFESWCEECDLEVDTWPTDVALNKIYGIVFHAGEYDPWENEMVENLV